MSSLLGEWKLDDTRITTIDSIDPLAAPVEQVAIRIAGTVFPGQIELCDFPENVNCVATRTFDGYFLFELANSLGSARRERAHPIGLDWPLEPAPETDLTALFSQPSELTAAYTITVLDIVCFGSAPERCERISRTSTAVIDSAELVVRLLEPGQIPLLSASLLPILLLRRLKS